MSSMSSPLDAVYVTYWSFRDPLTESQCLPVLRSLVARGYKLGLVTYESGPPDAADAAQLRDQGISWYPLSYHRRPPLVSTLWDALRGLRLCLGLKRQLGVKLFHSRGSVPAAPAMAAAAMTGARFFYDADGPLSEEYVDAGLWSNRSLGYLLTRAAERRFLRSADAVAVLTQERRRALSRWTQKPITVLPCGVDTDHFTYRFDARERIRREIGLDGTVMVYAGKWGGWYAVEEMMDFIVVARDHFPRLHLLVLTREPPDRFHAAATRRGLADALIVREATRETMPQYLSAADVGLSFVRPLPSKTACSPVKNAEYLACGLPIVTPHQIGDYSELVARNRVGVVLRALEPTAYADAAVGLRDLLNDAALKSRCRTTAENEMGLNQVVVPKYLQIYRDLIGVPTSENSELNQEASRGERQPSEIAITPGQRRQ